MQKEQVSWSTVFKFAGAFVAFLIGSGFATGQEILQYFTSYGYAGLLTALAVLVLFVYAGGSFITVGYREKLSQGSEIFTYYCGKYIGKFYDYFTVLFVFMSYVVMIAGAGATLNQQYGLPVWVGGVLMMCLAGGTVLMGLGKIVDVIGRIGPLIVLIAVGVGLFSIVRNPAGIAEGAQLIANNEVEIMQAGSNWFMSACSYVGFCMLWLAAFLAALGNTAHSAKEACIGTTLGAIGFALGCVVMMLGLLANVADVAGTQIPALVLALYIHPAFAVVFSIIIFAGIFTTAVPLLWQTSSRFTAEGTPKFVKATIGIAVLGCFIGLVLPFDQLVNVIYVINGYVGILLLAFIVVKQVRTHKQKK